LSLRTGKGPQVPVDSSVLAAVFSSAGAGTALIVVLLLTGILSTKRYTDRLDADAAYWKAAAETERQVSAAKDTALTAAVQRADAAVEVANLTKELLEDLRRRTDAAAAKSA
jgi:hypothetical protein